MAFLSSRIHSIEPEHFWNWSRILLSLAFGFILALVLLSTWMSTTALLVLGALFLGGLIFAFVAQDEVAILSAIIAGFVVAARYEEGFQVEEILYGLLYMGYLTYWFTSRLFFYQDKILRTKIDWAIFLFLVYVTLSLALTPLLQGDMRTAISEWLSVTMLAFYFPIKELCIRRPDRIPEKPILLSLGLVAAFIAIRNLIDYRIGLSQADYLWQIASGRVVMNEHVLLMAGLVTLVFLLFAREWLARGTLAFFFMLYSVGVLIGQSRAVWVAYALGMAIIFFMVDKKKRIQLTLLGVASLAAATVVGLLVFDNFFTLIVAGLADRFFSLQSAATKDISLINRFVEMGAAWEYIKMNPIVGHGFGVPIKYYSLVFEYTRVESFIHNGYVGVLYRHGLIGFCLLFFFYFGTAWRAFRTARYPGSAGIYHIVAIAALAFFGAEGLVGNTENPFATSDKTLIIGAVAGLAAAAWHRTRLQMRDANAE